MGILDDAIRQHLELKRQHGAGDDDLDRLEKEAFGPATRPGDPEFVEQEGSPEDSPEGESEELETFGASEAETRMLQGPEAAEVDVTEEPSDELELPEDLEGGEEPAEDATSAVRARSQHADLGDTADHPAPTQLGPEDEAEPAPPQSAEPAAAAEEPPEAPESGIFDAEEFDFSDLDLGLEDEEPPAPIEAAEAPAEIAPEPAAEPDAAPEPDPEPAVEPEPEPDGEPVEPEPDAQEPEPDPRTPAEDPLAADEAKPTSDEEGSDEDLLEETPDFLQETEGEDLWFEQGPPRDFDFDDD